MKNIIPFLIAVVLCGTLMFNGDVVEEINTKHYNFYDTVYPQWKQPYMEFKPLGSIVRGSVGIINGVVTAYTNRPEETDDTPDITASGRAVREGMVANNCLDFGQRVEIFGKVYEVQDRMNRRYGCYVFDIFMFDLEEARGFGVVKTDIRLLDN